MQDHDTGQAFLYPHLMIPFLLSHVSVDSSLALASVASITFFSVSPSIITVQACDTPLSVFWEKGQFFCLALNRMYTFVSSLPVSLIKVKERHMFLDLSLSISLYELYLQDTTGV